MLKQFSLGCRVNDYYTDKCSPIEGAVTADKSHLRVLTAVSGNSGLYWCEGAEGRSNAVNITVSCESCVMLKTLDKLGRNHKRKQNVVQTDVCV